MRPKLNGASCETVGSGAGLLRLDWHSAPQIMERAVERGLKRSKMETVRLVGIDEKSFGRGQDDVSLMIDLEQSRVLDVVPGRTAEACQELWTRLGELDLPRFGRFYAGIGPRENNRTF